jgi:hypothetical protein
MILSNLTMDLATIGDKGKGIPGCYTLVLRVAALDQGLLDLMGIVLDQPL